VSDLCFLWHMHQPCYHDASTGEMTLPWVRLHATKAYLDMAEALTRAPSSIKVTVNFVPVLLDQLDRYAKGTVKDSFLELSRKPADKLSPDETRFVLRYFFMANWETMVRPYPRYYALLVKRGMHAEADLDAAARRFSPEEIRDLQVWFNLAWFGWAARVRFPVVRAMLDKGQGFSEEDKLAVLDAQLECIRAIVPAWRKLSEEGKVELTATPFYHPILPLVINTRTAHRAIPDLPLPEDFVAPDDAQEQVTRAAKFHQATWGVAPQGMWPAEGSVCPEVVPLFRKAGVQWIATDEDVLFLSLGRRDRDRDLYRPWRFSHGGEEITLFFRDRILSDLVGFTYSKMRAQDAAADMVNRVRHIAHAAGHKSVISVILDGENPWEYYPDGGEAFLSQLYQGLANVPGLRTTSFSTHLADRRDGIEPMGGLHSGSWINANYRIWIGHHEDNAGWNLLKRAREDVRARMAGPGVGGGQAPLSAEAAAAATDNLMRAEGSDWFWWYGDDFHSDNDAEFDLLFRTHVSNAYRAAGLDPPAQLLLPISSAAKSVATREPFAFISPRIDGIAESYYEWKGAGYYAIGKSEGTMHKGTAYLVGIHYGFDVENLYLRLDPVSKSTRDGQSPATGETLTMAVSLMLAGDRGAVEHRVVFPFVRGVGEWTLLGPRGNEPLASIGKGSSLAFQKVAELSLPLASFGARPGAALDLAVRVMNGEVEIDRYPRTGSVRVTVPGEDFERLNWWV
jgi:alpha-amylase/alpha-mannosidase (GH57 family)